MNAKGTYSVKKWEETVYNPISVEQKMTKASVEYSMSGEIIGNASVEYLMFYKYFDANDQHKSTAVYIGMMNFTGTLQGKHGSVVFEDHGTFENGTARSTLKIISGSGTGELVGIEGTGRYNADQHGIHIELDFTL